MSLCIVSYLDTGSIRHTVEVNADSLYEVSVLAICTFKDHHCEPGLISQLQVEIRSSVTHTVTPRKIHDWLNGVSKDSEGSRTERTVTRDADTTMRRTYYIFYYTVTSSLNL